MKIRLTHLLFFIILGANCIAQNNSILNGTVHSDKLTVKDVHIINLNSSIGTISNNNGQFKISAQVNDILLFSSIQYERIKITVTEQMLSSEDFNIEFKSLVNMLDEVTIT